MKTLNIIGAGNVGKVFAQLFGRHGIFQIQDVLNQSMESAAQAVEWIGFGHPVAQLDQMRPADVTMLSVPDDEVMAVSDAWVACGLAQAGAVIFHCSGALSSMDLIKAKQRGVAVASVHPVRSFADSMQVAAHFSGTCCGVEGDDVAIAVLKTALDEIGAQIVWIRTDMKTMYHAASVLACNHVTALIDLALKLYQAAGISEQGAYQLAEPLVTETIRNIFRLGSRQALSGPVARGDWHTVAKQQDTLDAWNEQAGEVYRVLTELTKAFAARKK